MKATKFRILEVVYLIMLYELFCYSSIISFGMAMALAWEPLLHPKDPLDVLLPAYALLAELIGIIVLIYLLFVIVPGMYRHAVSDYIDAPYPAQSLGHVLGLSLLGALPLLCIILCCLFPEHSELYGTIFVYATAVFCLISTGLIFVMLFMTWFMRHHRRVRPTRHNQLFLQIEVEENINDEKSII